MPLPTNPEARKKAAKAVVAVMSLPPKHRREALARAKEIAQERRKTS